jgi:hypothetical protein
MAKEIKDINKSFGEVCKSCNFQSNCPYIDKSACLEVRSSQQFNEKEDDSKSNSIDLSKANNENL